MATKEQIETLLAKLEESCPAEIFKCINDSQVGIGAVLRVIYESNEMVTAGTISDALNISTARVAVLLKKMVEKGLIIKEHSPKDARVTVVKLSELGEKKFTEMCTEIYSKMSHVIDTVGEERLLEFLAISCEIRSAVELPVYKL